MVRIDWEYKLEGLNPSGQWMETNSAGGYHTHDYVYKLLKSHLEKRPRPDFRNFRIWKRPKQGWELVLNVAINEEVT